MARSAAELRRDARWGAFSRGTDEGLACRLPRSAGLGLPLPAAGGLQVSRAAPIWSPLLLQHSAGARAARSRGLAGLWDLSEGSGAALNDLSLRYTVCVAQGAGVRWERCAEGDHPSMLSVVEPEYGATDALMLVPDAVSAEAAAGTERLDGLSAPMTRSVTPLPLATHIYNQLLLRSVSALTVFTEGDGSSGSSPDTAPAAAATAVAADGAANVLGVDDGATFGDALDEDDGGAGGSAAAHVISEFTGVWRRR